MKASDLITQMIDGESAQSIVNEITKTGSIARRPRPMGVVKKKRYDEGSIVGKGPSGWDSFDQFFSYEEGLWKEKNKGKAERIRAQMLKIRDKARKSRQTISDLQSKWDALDHKAGTLYVYPRMGWRDVVEEALSESFQDGDEVEIIGSVRDFYKKTWGVTKGVVISSESGSTRIEISPTKGSVKSYKVNLKNKFLKSLNEAFIPKGGEVNIEKRGASYYIIYSGWGYPQIIGGRFPTAKAAGKWATKQGMVIKSIPKDPRHRYIRDDLGESTNLWSVYGASKKKLIDDYLKSGKADWNLVGDLVVTYQEIGVDMTPEAKLLKKAYDKKSMKLFAAWSFKDRFKMFSKALTKLAGKANVSYRAAEFIVYHSRAGIKNKTKKLLDDFRLDADLSTSYAPGIVSTKVIVKGSPV